MKDLLREVLPGIKVFLPEDDLREIAHLEHYVGASHVVVVFVSRGYFESKRCMRELRAAAEQQKKIVIICESDAGKGAISLPDELKTLAKGERALHDYLVPAAKRGIEWRHDKPLQEVTLTELAKQLVEDFEISAQDPLVLMGSVVDKMTIRMPRVAASAAHIYISDHNEGAMAFVLHELQAQPCFKRTPIRFSQSLDEVGAVGGRSRARSCLRCWRGRRATAVSRVFLLYLDGQTWGGQARNRRERLLQAERRKSLARDVAMAMDLRMNVLLLHELDGPSSVPFAAAQEGAPAPLVEWGLFAEGAIALHAGIFRPVAAHLAVAELAELLAREPKEWEAARMAGGAVRSLEELDEVEEAQDEGAEGVEAGEADGVDFDAAEGGAEGYMEEGIIVQGIDDMAGMSVNPVHLERMQTQLRANAKGVRSSTAGKSTSEALPTAARLPRPGAWARLGIAVNAGVEHSAGVTQLKKLEKFLAQEQGVVLPTEAQQAAVQESDLAAPDRSEIILKHSKSRRRGMSADTLGV